MDKRKGLINVIVSISFKLLTTVAVIIVRKLLIEYCGNEVNGLNALYLSIVGFLAIAELGVGSAITFCMYKPIVEQENDKVSALYHLFRKLYMIIGGIILIAGLSITPFIHFFANDYTLIDENLYLTFVLMLLSVVLTYVFSSKTSLINAYKNNYITTAITSGGLLFQYVLQIIVLIMTHSFVGYLVCRIVAVLYQWILTDIITKRKYEFIIKKKNARIDSETQKLLFKNIKAMFMHKIGTLLVNTIDSVIISAFLGVVILGKYSNYITIMVSVTAVLKLCFSSLTSVIGHMYVEEDLIKSRKYCETFHRVNFIIGLVFFLGYYAIIDNIIYILFSPDLVVSKSISFVIALNEFIQFLRQSVVTFREATGTFYYDRWKPLIEGIFNVIFSIILVNIIGVVGVIVATILTNLLICHIIEPYVLYKNAFLSSPKKYYIKNYGMIILFFISLILLNYLMIDFENVWKELFVNGIISVIIAIVASSLALLFDKEMRRNLIETVKLRFFR